jgi:hypothetical protein
LTKTYPHISESGVIVKSGNELIDAESFTRLCVEKFGANSEVSVPLPLSQGIKPARDFVQVDIAIAGLAAGSFTIEVIYSNTAVH